MGLLLTYLLPCCTIYFDFKGNRKLLLTWRSLPTQPESAPSEKESAETPSLLRGWNFKPFKPNYRPTRGRENCLQCQDYHPSLSCLYNPHENHVSTQHHEIHHPSVPAATDDALRPVRIVPSRRPFHHLHHRQLPKTMADSSSSSKRSHQHQNHQNHRNRAAVS